ncbi:FG-GAP repeat domain-containing protein [Paenibacillus sp. strain BS8-2]
MQRQRHIRPQLTAYWNVARGSMLRQTLVLVLIAAVLVLAGCQYTAAPADLLRKPLISDEKVQLLEAVTKALPEFSILMLPHDSSDKEAIRLIDLDGDGKQEAVVTYYNEYSSPEIMALRLTENGWRQWLLVQQPLAREMTWLSIEDLDGDGVKEMAVGWVGAFDSATMLEIYSFNSKTARNDKGKLTMIPAASLPFSLADSADLDRDGERELAVVSGSISSGTTSELVVPIFQLTLYVWEDGRLIPRSKVTLPEGVNLFERIQMGRISVRQQGIVLEGGTGAHSMLTYMYAWSGLELTLVFPTEEQERQGLGFSGKPTRSRDMNGDGIIELPRITEAKGHEDVPYSDSLWLTEWLQWDGRNDMIRVSEQYVDENHGIRLDIPDSWSGKLTLETPPRASYGIVTLQYFNETTNEMADLITIYEVPNRQWKSVEHVWRDEKRAFKTVGIHSGNQYAVSFYNDEIPTLSEQARADIEEMMVDRDRLLERLLIGYSE